MWKSKAIGRVCEVLLGVEGLNTKVCALEGVELFGFNKQEFDLPTSAKCDLHRAGKVDYSIPHPNIKARRHAYRSP